MRTRVERAHTKSSLHAVRADTSPRSLESQLDTQQLASVNCWRLLCHFTLFRALQGENTIVSSFGLEIHAAVISPTLPSPSTSMETQPLRFCFFSFDCLRFDWSSSNRFCCCSRRRGGLFLGFVLADSWRVSNCLGGFAPILVHFLRFASYGFALLLLLLLRKESLGGLKYLCSLLCLKKGRKYVYWREGIGIRVTSQSIS